MLRKSWPLIMAAALILTGCASGPQTLTFKVTGIDNDMALPEVPMDEVFRREPPLNAKAIEGMPNRKPSIAAATVPE